MEKSRRGGIRIDERTSRKPQRSMKREQKRWADTIVCGESRVHRRATVKWWKIKKRARASTHLTGTRDRIDAPAPEMQEEAASRQGPLLHNKRKARDEKERERERERERESRRNGLDSSPTKLLQFHVKKSARTKKENIEGLEAGFYAE